MGAPQIYKPGRGGRKGSSMLFSEPGRGRLLLHAEFILAMLSICINEARYTVQSMGCGRRVNSMKCQRAGDVSSQCLLPLLPQGWNLASLWVFWAIQTHCALSKTPSPKGWIWGKVHMARVSSELLPPPDGIIRTGMLSSCYLSLLVISYLYMDLYISIGTYFTVNLK